MGTYHRPKNTNIVCSMWLYRHKLNADGIIRCHKSCLIANGKSQQQGINCDETFSPLVKPATIGTVFMLLWFVIGHYISLT